jgi:hypothetical protein
MRSIAIVLSLILFAIIQPTPASAQFIDGSDLQREVWERQYRVSKLSTEDQLRLRAAEQKAAEDPEVKAALEKRNKAIEDFRTELRASIIKADPKIEPILAKVAIIRAQDLNDTLYRDQRKRESRFIKLTTEEQLKLVAVEKAAAEDPSVKAALEKRNKAIQEYRTVLRATMVRVEPTVAPILERVALGERR